jgi:hypothetical protein
VVIEAIENKEGHAYKWQFIAARNIFELYRVSSTGRQHLNPHLIDMLPEWPHMNMQKVNSSWINSSRWVMMLENNELGYHNIAHFPN